MEAKYPLMRSWVLYEMWEQNKKDASNYDKRMAEVSSFGDLHGFWQLWGHLPHSAPSQLFSVYESDGSIRKRVIVDINQSIEALSIFEQGVTPRWEDPANTNGCDIKTKQTCSDLAKIDEMWNNLVFAVIGETLPYSSEITGCRVVDKSKRNYNFEVWLRLGDQAEGLTEIRDALKNLFPERSVFMVTNHSSSK